MGHLPSSPPTTPWVVPPVLSLHHLQGHATEVPAMVGWICLGWAINTCPGSHGMANSPLAIAVPRKQYKNCLKIPWCLSHQPLPMDHPSWELWHLASDHHSYLKNTSSAILKDKRCRRKNYNTMPSNPNQPFSCCLSCIGLVSCACL